MTTDMMTSVQLESRIAELNALITYMERLSYGHMATTIRADIWVLEKELMKRKK